ncbi:MAG: serine hydroxymethyltransferase, partial [candidate division FCPU426 bacterium]
LTTGGTDNHLMLMDLRRQGLSGAAAATALEEAGMILNKNGVPFDSAPPAVTSGVRLGTAGVTTRGMKEAQMRQIAAWMDETLKGVEDHGAHKKRKKQVAALCKKFPIYS